MQKLKRTINKQTIPRQSLFGIFVQLRLQFNQFTIKHIFVVSIAIWVRVILGSFLNVVMVTTNWIPVYQTIKQMWKGMVNQAVVSDQTLANLIIIGILIVIFLVLTYQIMRKQTKARGGVVQFVTFFSILNPLLVRYLLDLLLKQQQSNLSSVLRIQCLVCLFYSIAIQIVFALISLGARRKSQNSLVRQRCLKILFKQFATLYLLIPLTQIFYILIPNTGANVGILAVQLLLSIIPIYMLIRQYVYINNFVDNIYLLTSCLQFSSSLLSFISELTNNSLFAQNMIILVVMVTFLLYISSRQYIGYRNHQIIMSSHKQKSVLKVYLHNIGGALLQTESESGNLQFIYNTLKNQHKETCKQSSCICKQDSKNDEKNGMKFFLIRTKFFAIMEENKDNFSLTLQCCYFMLEFFNAFPDLLFKLNSIRKKHNLNALQELEYECFKSAIFVFLQAKKDEANSIATQRIQYQDELIVAIANTMHSISIQKYDFWFNLGKKNPDVQLIEKLVATQNIQTNIIQDLKPEIYEKFHYSVVLLELINIYDICLKLKGKQSKQLKSALRNYYMQRNQEIKMLKQQSFNVESIMFGSNCVIFESAVEQYRMGVIMNTSKNICDVFGFKRQAIIGQNINQIMPKSMQDEHDVILDSWRQRASWDNVQKIRYIFAMTKDHICFSTAIYLRIVQRADSVNLLAAFFKANHNDYMIVNQDGIIDGVGVNFTKILGGQIINLPLSSICDNSRYLISEAKKLKQRRRTTITFYHTRGLEQMISAHQISKFKINTSESESILPEQQIKNANRLLNIYVSYEPYRMGSKFFVIFKFISHQKSQINHMDSLIQPKFEYLANDPSQNKELSLSLVEQKQENGANINLREFNTSIHTSNYETSTSSQNMFIALQQKVKNNSIFSNKIIRFYFNIVAVVTIVMVAALAVQQIFEGNFSQNFHDHTRQSIQLFYKSNSLDLAYSRLINIHYGMNSLNSAQFQLQRAFIELARVKQSIFDQHIQLWSDSQWGQNPILNRLIQYSGDEPNVKQITFQQFYALYLSLFRIIQSKEGDVKIQAQMQEKKIKQNIDNMGVFFDNNIWKLKENIVNDLKSAIILSRTVLATFVFFIIIISAYAFKIKKIQQQHSKEIFNVYLSISDRNCESCVTYFRQIVTIFNKSLTKNANGNDPRNIQKLLIESSSFSDPLQKIQFEMDKFHRKKTVTQHKIEGWKKLKIILLVLGVVMLGLIITKQRIHEYSYQIEHQFLNNYFKILTVEELLVSDFLYIKRILVQGSDLQVYQNYLRDFKNRLLLQDQGISGFASTFFSLLSSAQKLDSSFGALSESIYNLTLCNKIKDIDPNFHNNICQPNNAMFPFSRMKLFETHSNILQGLQNLANSLLNNNNKQAQFYQMINVSEQMINLNYIFLCNFVELFTTVTQEYHNNKIRMLNLWIFGLIFLVLVLFVVATYYGYYTSQVMNMSCIHILIVPEIVLRYTKGAMKIIDNVLKSIS